VVVLTQYKSHSLDRHVTKTWRMSTMLGNYVAPIPAQQRVDKNWYLGSADAIYQSLNTIADEKPDIIVVVGADHVYRMDFSQMVDQHIQTGAGATVAAIRQPIEMADQFGVIEVDDDDPTLISAFREKPSDPKGLPGAPHEILASMGNYVFSADVLIDAVTKDHDLEGSKHDMGGDIIPALVKENAAYAYDFKKNVIPGGTERDMGYWRDVGTLDSYYDAHMDLISIHPIFNLYNYDWPIYTDYGPYPPAKFVHGHHGRFGEALNSAVSPGTVISGARVTGSIVGANVRVHSYSEVDESVILDNVVIGRNCKIRKAIIDKNVIVPEGCEIGIDHDRDRARGFEVTDGGVVVIGKGQKVVV
jgi:glucose-1-phosphate adenylyltransferase